MIALNAPGSATLSFCGSDGPARSGVDPHRTQSRSFAGMADETWRMPAPETVLAAIEEWRSIDIRTARPEQVIASMTAFRDKLQFWVVQANSSRPSKLWRVRVRREGDQFDTLGDLWEPPSGKTRLGRCNQAGSPVLYCSKDVATALDECEVAAGDELLLVKYAPTTQLRLNRIVGGFEPLRDGAASAFDGEGLLAYQIMREFLRSEFTKPVGKGTEWLYMISAAVSEVWATADGADGWLYPSVRSPREGNDNVAFVPAAAHAKLRVESAFWSVADDVRAELRSAGSTLSLPGIRLRHLKVADDTEHELRWLPIDPAEKRGLFAVRRT